MGTDACETAWFADSIPWPALVVDACGGIHAFNDALVDSQCVQPEPGEPFRKVLPHVWDALGGDPPYGTDQDVELKELSEGSCCHKRVVTRGLPGGSTVLFIVDSTASHEGDNEREQTERLASLGFMAASVCHELSNPLTAIRSLIQRLESDYHNLPHEDVQQSFSIIASNVDRVLTISRKLTEFSRVGSANRRPLRIDEPIEAALALTQHRPGCSKIQFHHTPDHSVQVRGDGDQLQQVFQNILVNCVQAIEGQGTILVMTGRRDSHFAEVRITDTGPGIDPDLIDRLFEPFYTTKSSHGGSGLGLVISNEIVHEHQGRIRVESATGSGTSFVIELPLCPRDSENQ